MLFSISFVIFSFVVIYIVEIAFVKKEPLFNLVRWNCYRDLFAKLNFRQEWFLGISPFIPHDQPRNSVFLFDIFVAFACYICIFFCCIVISDRPPSTLHITLRGRHSSLSVNRQKASATFRLPSFFFVLLLDLYVSTNT